MSETIAVMCAGCGAPGERELVDHGGPFGEFVNSLPWHCPPCAERLEAEEAAAEQREQDRQAHVRLDTRSSIPQALRRDLSSLEVTPRNAQALDAARAWSLGELPGLLLTGPVGTGKTSIAAAAAWERNLRYGVVWTSVPVMLAKALAAFDDEDRAEAMRAITGVGSLVLDDLDKVKPSEWAATQLFAAIDSRYAQGAPLLVTTNLTLDQLADKLGVDFGDAIASRLAEYCRTVVIDGPDRRLAGASS
jgi:DNA replication protein DnaC